MSEGPSPADPHAAARPPLQVDVLGTPVVRVHGGALDVDTRKALAVLAVLAVALADGRPAVPRASLAALLWPDADDARARGTLRRTLSVLVAATAGAVHADRTAVSLVPERVTSDVVTFRRLAHAGGRDDLARAVGLVRGELLAGFSVRDSAPFDDWVAQTSAGLRRELGAVLERLVLARLRHGELHAALADAVRWLDLDPLHEPAHRSLMRLLAWTGRRGDALDHYHRCVRLLGDELGVAPVRATTEVYEAIRAGTLPPPRRPPADPTGGSASASAPGVVTPTPPAPAVDVVPMVGRADAMGSLQAALGRGGRLVVVTGEAGVGRSRLVEEFAGAAGPVLLVRAHGGETALSFAPVTDLVRAAVARGGPPAPELAVEVSRLVPELLPAGRSPAPPLSSLGARDRFYDAVVAVLAGSGATAVVVEDVHAAGPASAEVLAYLVHRLDRLPMPLVLTWRAPGLPARHPVQRAIGSGRHHDRTTTVTLGRLSRADVAALANGHGYDADAIWRDTAGLPLLVAGALRAGGDELPLTVRDLLAARLAEVSEETAQVVAALAVLDGVADPDVLRAVSGRTEEETVEAVEEALRAGLVREEAAGLAFPHEALRRVAYDGLSLVRRRLLHARAAETLAARPDAAEQAGAIAVHFHLGGRDDAAAGWAWRAAQRSRGLYAHAEARHQLEFAASLGRDDVEVSLARGDVLVALGRYETARDAYARALAFTADPAGRAAVERRMADVAVRLGEWSRAAVGLEAAVELAGDDVALRARLLADRAVVAVRAGDPATATGSADLALALAPTDPYVLDVAGLVALAAADVEGATARFRAALATLAERPDPTLEAAVLNNLALARARAGDSEAAVATAREALALGRTSADRHRLAALHANLADRLHERGDAAATAEAMEHLKESAALFAEVGADPLDRPDVWTLTSW